MEVATENLLSVEISGLVATDHQLLITISLLTTIKVFLVNIFQYFFTNILTKKSNLFLDILFLECQLFYGNIKTFVAQNTTTYTCYMYINMCDVLTCYLFLWLFHSIKTRDFKIRYSSKIYNDFHLWMMENLNRWFRWTVLRWKKGLFDHQ